jgi:hypothetical protein
VVFFVVCALLALSPVLAMRHAIKKWDGLKQPPRSCPSAAAARLAWIPRTADTRLLLRKVDGGRAWMRTMITT